MTFRISMLTVSAAAALAVPAIMALDAPAYAAGVPLQCKTISSTSVPSTASLLGLLGIPVRGNTPVGITCVAAPPPATHNFCATDNNYNGLVALGRASTGPC